MHSLVSRREVFQQRTFERLASLNKQVGSLFLGFGKQNNKTGFKNCLMELGQSSSVKLPTGEVEPRKTASALAPSTKLVQMIVEANKFSVGGKFVVWKCQTEVLV